MRRRVGCFFLLSISVPDAGKTRKVAHFWKQKMGASQIKPLKQPGNPSEPERDQHAPRLTLITRRAHDLP